MKKWNTIIWTLCTLLLLSGVNAQSYKGFVPSYEFHYLSTTGGRESNGNISGSGNYSLNGRELYFQPDNVTMFRVNDLKVVFADDTGTQPTSYGNLNALSVGVSVWVEINGTKSRIDNNQSVTSLGEYMVPYHDVACLNGNTVDYCSATWSFVGHGGSYIRLNGSNNDKIIVMLNDSFIGLNYHRFAIQGYKEPSNENEFDVLENIKEDNDMLALVLVLLGVLYFMFIYSKNMRVSNQSGQPALLNVALQYIANAGMIITLIVLIVLGAAIAVSQNLPAGIINPTLNWYQFLTYLGIIALLLTLFGFIIQALVLVYQSIKENKLI